MVVCRTPEREGLGLKPNFAVLCPQFSKTLYSSKVLIILSMWNFTAVSPEITDDYWIFGDN